MSCLSHFQLVQKGTFKGTVRIPSIVFTKGRVGDGGGGTIMCLHLGQGACDVMQ